tara:strand:- start:4648 stop:5190 length:543 start_codon:yes stop_codon:yes gene_type:complete
MEALVDTLRGTPWWVWLILAYLIVVGIRRSKTTVSPMWKVFILPAIILVLELGSVRQQLGADPLHAAVWLAGLAAGAGVGLLLVRSMPIRADRSKGLVEIPGSWSYLVALLLIFGIKYYFGYKTAVDPATMSQPGWVMGQLAITGALAGWLIGRAGGILWKYRAAAHSTLGGPQTARPAG